jgi:hypothetical protein
MCVAGFIPTKYSQAVNIKYRGDDRGFSAYGDADTESSRFWVWIDAETGGILNGAGKGEVHPTCYEDNTCDPPNDGYNRITASKNENGSLTLSYSVICSHAACLFGPEGTLTFMPNEYGSYDVNGVLDPFPSLEAYHWKSGKLQNPYIFRDQNFTQQELDNDITDIVSIAGMLSPVGLSVKFIEPSVRRVTTTLYDFNGIFSSVHEISRIDRSWPRFNHSPRR